MISTVVYIGEMTAIKPQSGPAFKRMPITIIEDSGFSTRGLLATSKKTMSNGHQSIFAFYGVYSMLKVAR